MESSGTKLNYGTVETGAGVYINVIGASTSVLDANEATYSQGKATLSAIANNGGFIGNSVNIDGLYDGGQDIVAQVFYNHTLSSNEKSIIDSVGYGIIGSPYTVPDLRGHRWRLFDAGIPGSL